MSDKMLLESLSTIAHDLMEEYSPAIAARTTIEVRYFGGGNKFTIRHNSEENTFFATLYVHASSMNGLPTLVRESVAAAERILRDRVTISKRSLELLTQSVDLTNLPMDVQMEIRTALGA